MKKITATILAVGVLFASESIESPKNLYIVPKWIHTFGDTYHNEEGDCGNGIGLNLGYRLGHGFAIEIDATYEKTTVREKEEGISYKEDAKYFTTSLDFAYTYELTHDLGLLLKVGYEYEKEKIANETKHDTGVIYAAGFEYELDEKFKFVMEYEKSTIDGPKGDMITAGLMYNFDL